MRCVKLCAFLGAMLLPAAQAGPCRPRPPTSPSPTLLTTSTETPSSSTETPISSTETPILTETPISIETPTPTDIFITTETDTTFVSSAELETPSVTPTELTTEVTPTPTPTPTAENLILNGDFEGEDLSVWQVRTVTIEKDASKAASPSHYARYVYQDQFGSGGNQLNQTINGLYTDRLYRLSFSGAVHGLPNLGEASCMMEALLNQEVFASWAIENFVVGEYSTYSTDFTTDDEDATITLRLRCTNENRVSIDFGVDDVVVNEIGVRPMQN